MNQTQTQQQTNETRGLEWVNCNYCASNVTRVIYDFQPLKIVKCKRCGLVYTNPRLELRIIGERLYKDDYWKAYEKYLETSLPALQKFCKSWLDKLGNYTRAKRLKICEIGPGLGVFLAEAKKRGHEVYGIDFSKYAINFAKARFGIDTIRQGTADLIDSLGLPKMDAFVMLATIEHLQDPLSVLRKVNACLSFNQIVGLKAWSIIAPQGHLYYFSKRTIRMFLEKAGFLMLTLETNSALINELTKNKLLVKLFNNPITSLLMVPRITQRSRLGDEMFIISRKVMPIGDS